MNGRFITGMLITILIYTETVQCGFLLWLLDGVCDADLSIISPVSMRPTYEWLHSRARVLHEEKLGEHP